MKNINMVEIAAFPQQLTQSQQSFASLLTKRPDAWLPTDAQLDALLECKQLPDNPCEGDLGFDEYFNWYEDVLPSIQRWASLVHTALCEPNDSIPHPATFEKRKLLKSSLSNLLVAFPDANEECEGFMTLEGFPVKLAELMRRYRLYTRLAQTLIFEAWPGVNRELVTTPDYSKGPRGEPFLGSVA